MYWMLAIAAIPYVLVMFLMASHMVRHQIKRQYRKMGLIEHVQFQPTKKRRKKAA